LLAGINQPAIDLVRRRRGPHAKHAVLGMENHFAFGGHMIGHLQRRTDAEIDVPALRNVTGDARRHFIARKRPMPSDNVHCSLIT
jgi:predicted DNA-binding protein with PD1-like motif